MTLRKIRIISFVVYAIYLILFLLLIGIVFQDQTFFDIDIWDVFLPIVMAAVFVFVIDYQRSYYLDPSQEEEVRDHLRKLGYLPTSDPGGQIFFRRRKLITWHIAKLQKGEKFLVLRSSENHGKYFKKGQKEE